MQIHVIVQIGYLPRKVGRVRQHADFVVVEAGLAVDELQHDLLAARVRDAPVDGRADGGIDRYDPYGLCGGFDFVYGGELREYPRDILEIRERPVVPGRIVGRVFAVMGEVEQSG